MLNLREVQKLVNEICGKKERQKMGKAEWKKSTNIAKGYKKYFTRRRIML